MNTLMEIALEHTLGQKLKPYELCYANSYTVDKKYRDLSHCHESMTRQEMLAFLNQREKTELIELKYTINKFNL